MKRLTVTRSAALPLLATRLSGQLGLQQSRSTSTSMGRANTSSASLPLAVHGAVTEGVMDRPMRRAGRGGGRPAEPDMIAAARALALGRERLDATG